MGNTSKKLAAKCTILTKEEQKYVGNTFRNASHNSGTIREDDLIVSGKLDAVSLEKYWGPLIDPRLAKYLANFLFGTGPNKQETCSFNRFAELYVFNVRGTVDDKLKVLNTSLELIGDNAEVPHQLLKEYCESIASTYVRVAKSSTNSPAHKWMEKGFQGRACYIQALGEAIVATIGEADKPKNQYAQDELYRWISSNQLLAMMTELVFMGLYGVESRAHGLPPPALLPAPQGIDAFPDYPALLDLAHMVWLNAHLPNEHQHQWRFLFSTHIHGQSYSTLAGRIQDSGATVLIVEDNHGYIFGGYAPESWHLSPNFYGNNTAFLFQLAPKMRIYSATSYNNHYQYMNWQTKTLPNGIMMGGQFGFAGIWINADPFGGGKSVETCTTFSDYKQLSKDTEFQIRTLEVWGVGEKPMSLKESERDVSILDTDPEAKAILELAGRTRHSEGLREPDL